MIGHGRLNRGGDPIYRPDIQALLGPVRVPDPSGDFGQPPLTRRQPDRSPDQADAENCEALAQALETVLPTTAVTASIFAVRAANSEAGTC